ncbi:MAG TPA: dienelactone hydrolase family protein [Reyranella sp.]|nr:dienelactone hydrolase family protein [Reyranella sp.]
MDGDRVSLNDRGLSRRTTLAAGTTLGAGFALAAQPICAQTVITTSTDGLTAGEVKVKTKDGKEMMAYRAMPSSGTGFGTVLVVQEIFGVHEHIKDVTRRFAKAGFYAIAPDLYFRQGDATKISDIQQLLKEIVSKVPDEQVMNDLDSTAAFVKAEGKGDASKLGVTGFCWGGRIVWLYVAHNPAVKAGVAWYGRVIGDPSPMTPKHPIDVVNQLKGPVQGLYGGADSGIPNDTVDKMRDALKSSSNTAARKSTIKTYADTPHGFNADYRPSYRKEQAEDAWKLAVAWFKANGVG